MPPKKSATAEEPQIADEPVEATEAAEQPEAEAADDNAIAELNAKPIPMRHPDGGTCDLYKTDKQGNILVPSTEAAAMIEHGFIVVDEA